MFYLDWLCIWNCQKNYSGECGRRNQLVVYLVWFFYVLNMIEITIDMILYFRNVKLDKERDANK